MSRVGLVCTFRFAAPPVVGGGDREKIVKAEVDVQRCWSVLTSFLRFHLAKGVEHIFLYADADDGSNKLYTDRIADEFDIAQVSVDVRSESQMERQRAHCRVWHEVGPFSTSEVPARQSLNAEDAMRRAATMQLDWLLHLDMDELFYTQEPSIKPHFDRLNELGVEHMIYANHEAVPHREDVKDYFREVTLFRVHHLQLPLCPAVGECTRFWRRRSEHGQYMLAYDNGKAAVRVLPDKVIPQSVHRWRPLRHRKEIDANGTSGRRGASANAPGTKMPIEGLVARVAIADPRELRMGEFMDCDDPCILHYPNCGLDWMRDKYRLLGDFSSSWFGGKLPIAPCFHLDARDAIYGRVLRGRGTPHREDESEGIKRLYRTQVMFCPDENDEELSKQLEHGVLRVIDGPAQTLESLQQPPEESRETVSLVAFESTHARPQQRGRMLEGTKESNRPPLHVGDYEESKTSAAVPSTGCEEGTSAVEQVFGDVDKRMATATTGFDNSWILAACAREFL